MARARTHKDVEFEVGGGGRQRQVFRRFDEAVMNAMDRSISRGGETVEVGVLIYSEAGARWWGGESALESYREDPEASVSELIAVRAESHGRIA